mmetsp:Transcript_9919/g.30066  ORF Transcript_9919/g.30066 Transcript_9919/m.30066 type:complete len:246 (-) Transcript_9919:696-1433(-)
MAYSRRDGRMMASTSRLRSCFTESSISHESPPGAANSDSSSSALRDACVFFLPVERSKPPLATSSPTTFLHTKHPPSLGGSTPTASSSPRGKSAGRLPTGVGARSVPPQVPTTALATAPSTDHDDGLSDEDSRKAGSGLAARASGSWSNERVRASTVERQRHQCARSSLASKSRISDPGAEAVARWSRKVSSLASGATMSTSRQCSETAPRGAAPERYPRPSDHHRSEYRKYSSSSASSSRPRRA